MGGKGVTLVSTQPKGNIHTHRIYWTMGSLTRHACPLYVKIWNAFLQIFTFFLKGRLGADASKEVGGGNERRGKEIAHK